MTHVNNLFKYDCLFSAYIYANEAVRLEENELAVALGDLITESRGESYTGIKPCRTLSIENFSTDFFKVIEAEDVSICRFEESHITKIHGPHIVLTNMDGKVGVYLHRGDTDFFIKSNHHLALKVNTQLVTPEYMAYMLLTSDWAKKISSYDMGPRISVRNFVRLSSVQVPILFLEDQKQFIRTKLSDYHQEQVRIKKADLERLGFRDVYSDVIHMLGTPFHKQGQVISLLERTSKDDEKYPQRVKALMDISMYIQRIIDIVGKDFSSTEADLDTLDLSDFIIEYHSAWNNYASGVYRMRIEIDADGCPMTIEADKDLLMVLMDTLTDNAKRHGFAPEYNPNNLVNISLQHVVFNEIPCVLLSVSNNGYPLKEGFTIQDYITRGRFEGKNGRTGLGGNHVHTIVKKHGGWLNIRSDKSWNFIVDMLFPMVNFANDDFNDYDYEAI
jgi:signal transduction histidine kinase